MSPLSRLARLLTVKEKTAWDFYLQVKKEFAGKALEIPAIIKCINQNRLSKPTPQQVADYLRGNGNSNLPSTTPRSNPLPKGSDSGLPSKGRGAALLPKGGDTDLPSKGATPALKPGPKDGPRSPLGTYHKQKRKNRSGDSSKYSGRVGSLRPGHDTRVYNKSIPRCPHGVLVTKKCALCDPDGFASSAGTD